MPDCPNSIALQFHPLQGLRFSPENSAKRRMFKKLKIVHYFITGRYQTTLPKLPTIFIGHFTIEIFMVFDISKNIIRVKGFLPGLGCHI